MYFFFKNESNTNIPINFGKILHVTSVFKNDRILLFKLNILLKFLMVIPGVRFRSRYLILVIIYNT